MDSPYKKSGMSNQKAAIIKNAIKSGLIALPQSLELPGFKLGYSIGLTGNIEPHEYLESFTQCSCKSDEEHEAKWKEYEKNHPPQPLDFDAIKSRLGYKDKENAFIDFMNEGFDKNIPEWKKRGCGRPEKFLKKQPLKYLITQEEVQNLERKGMTKICDYLRIKEKDLVKFMKEQKALTDDLFLSIAPSRPS